MRIVQRGDAENPASVLNTVAHVGAVVFDSPAEVQNLVAGIATWLHRRLPRVVRLFVSVDRLRELMLDTLRSIHPELVP